MEDVLRFSKKICILGDPSVGKTSLFNRYVTNEFSDKYITTMGVVVKKKIIEFTENDKDYEVTLNLWDVMGQHKFEITHASALNNAKGAIIVCDITQRETFDNISYWVGNLEANAGNQPFIIVANKNDLPGHQVDENDLRILSGQFDTNYFITSAKNNENVEETFLQIAKRCVL